MCDVRARSQLRKPLGCEVKHLRETETIPAAYNMALKITFSLGSLLLLHTLSSLRTIEKWCSEEKCFVDSGPKLATEHLFQVVFSSAC